MYASSQPRVPGAALTGAGVYYGAADRGARRVGGGDVPGGRGELGGQAAVYFARFAKEVVMLVRAPSLAAGMSQYLVDQIAATPNITVRTAPGSWPRTAGRGSSR